MWQSKDPSFWKTDGIRIMKGGFKIGGVNGHRAVHGTSWVASTFPGVDLTVKGCGVYTNNNPSNSFGYCGHGGEPSNQIIALRCLPGRYSDWTGGYWIGPGLNLDPKPDAQSVGSPTNVLVLKSSEQCLVTSSSSLGNRTFTNEIAPLRRSLFI